MCIALVSLEAQTSEKGRDYDIDCSKECEKVKRDNGGIMYRFSETVNRDYALSRDVLGSQGCYVDAVQLRDLLTMQ